MIAVQDASVADWKAIALLLLELLVLEAPDVVAELGGMLVERSHNGVHV